MWVALRQVQEFRGEGTTTVDECNVFQVIQQAMGLLGVSILIFGRFVVFESAGPVV